MELNGKDIFGKRRLDFMFRLACSILGRSDEAQDMMQDVAERILRRQEKMEGVRNIDAFLTQSVRNACIDRIRRRRETTPKIPDMPDEKSPDRWSDRIRTLCDRFFDGETTVDEEIMLKAYFMTAEDVPADLKAAISKLSIIGQKNDPHATYCMKNAS